MHFINSPSPGHSINQFILVVVTISKTVGVLFPTGQSSEIGIYILSHKTQGITLVVKGLDNSL